MQFDYGLRQMRFKKLDQRPASFTSGEGKIIWVEKKVAAINDRTVKRGRVCFLIFGIASAPQHVSCIVRSQNTRKGDTSCRSTCESHYCRGTLGFTVSVWCVHLMDRAYGVRFLLLFRLINMLSCVQSLVYLGCAVSFLIFLLLSLTTVFNSARCLYLVLYMTRSSSASS
jgi:hypothetical protein